MPDSSDHASQLLDYTDQQRAAIEADCLKLAYGFCQYSDRGDHDRYVALFIEGGRFSRPGLNAVGHKAILESIRQRPSTVAMRHVCASPLVTVVDRNHAVGSGSQVVYRHDRESGVTDPAILADYADEYVRTDGGWRIASRTVTYSF